MERPPRPRPQKEWGGTEHLEMQHDFCVMVTNFGEHYARLLTKERRGSPKPEVTLRDQHQKGGDAQDVKIGPSTTHTWQETTRVVLYFQKLEGEEPWKHHASNTGRGHYTTHKRWMHFSLRYPRKRKEGGSKSTGTNNVGASSLRKRKTKTSKNLPTCYARSGAQKGGGRDTSR